MGSGTERILGAGGPDRIIKCRSCVGTRRCVKAKYYRRVFWDFRSPGRGRVDFEGIVRQLNHADYQGPLTVEWEDPMMDREHGATEAAGRRRPNAGSAG